MIQRYIIIQNVEKNNIIITKLETRNKNNNKQTNDRSNESPMKFSHVVRTTIQFKICNALPFDNGFKAHFARRIEQQQFTRKYKKTTK